MMKHTALLILNIKFRKKNYTLSHSKKVDNLLYYTLNFIISKTKVKNSNDYKYKIRSFVLFKTLGNKIHFNYEIYEEMGEYFTYGYSNILVKLKYDKEV